MENNNATSNTTNTINTKDSNQQTKESYLEPCSYTTRLINKLKSTDTNNTLDFDLINKAIYWARKYHGEQLRKSGEPYYTHPLEVAYLLSVHNRPTTNLIVASILHDIIEDTEVTAGMIVDNFGWRIAEMVDMLTRDRPDGTKLSVEEILANAYKKDDNEVLLIKLVDRMHNTETIGVKPIEKQIKEANETFGLFIALSVFLEKYKIEKNIFKICKKIQRSKETNSRNRFKLKPYCLYQKHQSFLLRVYQNNSSLYQSIETLELI